MNIIIKKQSEITYTFTANGFSFSAKANPDSGTWVVPSFAEDSFGILRNNTAKLAYGQVVQFLRKNPLFVDTKKINGKTNKRIFERNPVFVGV